MRLAQYLTMLVFVTVLVPLWLSGCNQQKEVAKETTSTPTGSTGQDQEPGATTSRSDSGETAAITTANSTQTDDEPVVDITIDEDDQSNVPEGHSHFGHSFNEGPRQKAELMGGTGNIHFPVTTKSEEAQQFINQGVGQWHGFWFFEAERSFRQAAFLDPDCAMAYWGMAMSNFNGESGKQIERAEGFIAEAVKRRGLVSDREKMYIDALASFIMQWQQDKKQASINYVKSLGRIASRFSGDIDAKAFLAVQIDWNKKKEVGISIKSYYAVDKLLNAVFAENPMHPCHHFAIHLWDDKNAPEALDSAARCGQSAPSIAHMWHMPGHIYSNSKVKRFQDAVWHQEASARLDHAYMIRERILPDQIFNYPHNNEWFVRNLSIVGRLSDALALAKNMIELPRHPKYNAVTKIGEKYTNRSSYYGRLRLFNVLRDWELWEEAIKLTETPYLEVTDVPLEQMRYYRYRGIALIQNHDLAGGDEMIEQLQQLAESTKQKMLSKANAARDKAVKDGKSKQEIDKAVAAAQKPSKNTMMYISRSIAALRGYLAYAEGDHDKAIQLMTASKYVDDITKARVKFDGGDQVDAIEMLQSVVRKRRNEVLPLAHLVHLTWEASWEEDAQQAMEKLRKVAATADLDAPVLARLAPIAKHFGMPEDWRIPHQPPADIGKRPELKTLGPVRWRPSRAPEFNLVDAHGKTHSLKDYHGKPVIVIFYLGFGCLHCAEQLQEFGPMAQQFRDAGFEMIAVSTDDESDLQRSIENYDKGNIPFPLVSNPDQDIFKAYRCYDEFEQIPLHGTFFVDPDGYVRWLDVNYTPFLDAEFLLAESQRLIGQTHASVLPQKMAKPINTAALESTPAQRPVETIDNAVAVASATTANDIVSMQPGRQISNSIAMQLVQVPAGDFRMGQDDGQSHESPAHRVRISGPFFIGQCEVTQAQYKAVMGQAPSTFSGSNHPVEMVSWHDAVAFCRELSELPAEKAAGRVYRLPTEAEWEYACRAGSETVYSFGDTASQLDNFAWFRENSSGTSHPVASKQPNALGLHDMHGNVREWCSDWFDGDYYENSPTTDPEGPKTGKLRVFRGGSWGGPANFCRSASRFSIHPNYKNDYVGFRVVMTVAVPSS